MEKPHTFSHIKLVTEQISVLVWNTSTLPCYQGPIAQGFLQDTGEEEALFCKHMSISPSKQS